MKTTLNAIAIIVAGLLLVACQHTPEIKQQVVGPCDPLLDSRFMYPRRVGVVALQNHVPLHTVDFPNIESAYAEYLSEEIRSVNIIAQPLEDRSIQELPNAHMAPWPSVAEQARRVAKEAKVQFVVAGDIESLRATQSEGLKGRFSDWVLDEYQREKRITLMIYDGATGELVARQAFASVGVAKELERDNHYQASRQTMLDYLGTDTAALLQMQAEFVQNALACMPVQGFVTAVKGLEVTLDLGAEQGVRLGDEFELLRPVYTHLKSSVEESLRYEVYNRIKITEAGLGGAIGRVMDDAATVRVYVGDQVKLQRSSVM